MRLNPKIFALADGIEPVATQEFDNRLIEIYYMNDFEDVFSQNAPKGKFALWTSADGFNYRLFIEKGYYENLGELYTDKVNKIWLDFWDKCDDTTKKYNFRIMLPLAAVCLILFFVISNIDALASVAAYIQFGVLAVFIVGMLFMNKFVKNKLAFLNNESVKGIKDEVGEKHFEELLEEQKKYIDDFFEAQAKLAEEEEAKEENSDNNVSSEAIDLVEENKEDKTIEEGQEKVEVSEETDKKENE